MSNPPAQQDTELIEILGTDHAGSRFGGYGRWMMLAALLILTAIGYMLLRADDRAQVPRYETEKIVRGTL